MARTLRLNVLGRFQAHWSDSEPLDLSGKKAQALLAYLAVESRHAQPRETLATLLWGDTGEEHARHNLRQALSKIRQCCDSLVIANGDYLEIDPATCDIDVREFENLATSDNLDDLRRCIDLYQGDLLDGLNPREASYDDWLVLARARLKKTACRTAGSLAKALTDQGHIEQAIVALNDLLTIDPAHEPTHRDLMTLLARAGRRSDALRQYRVCVEALQRELAAEPSTETKQLHARLRQGGPDHAASDRPAAVAGPPSIGATPPSVAVLPFDNLSGIEDAYFVDGIAEDLTTALSCFHSLVVIARGSSFSYRDRDLTDQVIADELGAQYLVRGSVQRVANRVRINVQLLDAGAGLHVWGHRYDRELEDVFVLQDEITSTLVSTLAGRVEAAHLALARKAPPERLDAYDWLLKGKDHHHRYTAGDCQLCIQMFERAIERDPSYAVAYAWLACGLGQAMVFELDEIQKLVDRCQAAAEKGLELDENESECHRILAQVNLTRGNIKRALWHQERSLFLNPNDDRTVCAMGEILAFAGRAEEAEQWVRKSMLLNPYHPPRYWTHLARALFHQGRYEDALDAFEHVGKARRDDLAYWVAATAILRDSDAVVRVTEQLRDQFPDFDAEAFVKSLPYQREDYRRALLDPLTESLRGDILP